MKKQEALNSLERVVRTRYLATQQELRQHVKIEMQLRAELARLDQQAKDADGQMKPSMKMIGADIIWKSWLGRTRTELNLKLAQTLAQKEGYLKRVRAAYGKVLVAEELKEDLFYRTRKSAHQSEMERSIEMTLTPGSKTRR